MTTHLTTHLTSLFFLGSPAPGARPRGLGEHPPALPAPLRALKKKGPSPALMAAHPTGPLRRTVNNYFVVGCSLYFWAALWRTAVVLHGPRLLHDAVVLHETGLLHDAVVLHDPGAVPGVGATSAGKGKGKGGKGKGDAKAKAKARATQRQRQRQGRQEGRRCEGGARGLDAARDKIKLTLFTISLLVGRCGPYKNPRRSPSRRATCTGPVCPLQEPSE